MLIMICIISKPETSKVASICSGRFAYNATWGAEEKYAMLTAREMKIILTMTVVRSYL